MLLADEINVVGGFCCCTHLFGVGTNLLRTSHTCLVWRTLTDDDCCTDEGTPPPCAPSAWLNSEINVDGWWCCTHLFGGDDFWHLLNKVYNTYM